RLRGHHHGPRQAQRILRSRLRRWPGEFRGAMCEEDIGPGGFERQIRRRWRGERYGQRDAVARKRRTSAAVGPNSHVRDGAAWRDCAWHSGGDRGGYLEMTKTRAIWIS